MPKISLFIASSFAILMSIGCSTDGQSRSMPDRGSHAFNSNAPAQGQQPTSPHAKSSKASSSQGPAQRAEGRPGVSERVITVQYGEKLHTLAERYGTDVRHLIERNDLQRPLRAGDQLFVPAGFSQ